MSATNKNLYIRGNEGSPEIHPVDEAMLMLDDRGNDSGFGGVCGANRHVYPHEHSKVETLPIAQPANYGEAQGLKKEYGSRGEGDPGDQVSGVVTKLRYR